MASSGRRSNSRQRAIRRRALRMRRVRTLGALLGVTMLAILIVLLAGGRDKTAAVDAKSDYASLPTYQQPAYTDDPTLILDDLAMLVASGETSDPVYAQAEIKMLPVLGRVMTQGNKVAITVDDCQQTSNVMRIIDICDSIGAKVTFFPVARAVQNDSRTWAYAYERGFQIENHTFSHDTQLRSKEDDRIRWEINGLSNLVNQALGAKYHMRFLRTPGGNADGDPIVHRIAGELGYEYVAHWALVGSEMSASSLLKNLQAGQIVLYHAKAEDLKKLEVVLPKAVELGFELVTLNELLGLDPNLITPLEG